MVKCSALQDFNACLKPYGKLYTFNPSTGKFSVVSRKNALTEEVQKIFKKQMQTDDDKWILLHSTLY